MTLLHQQCSSFGTADLPSIDSKEPDLDLVQTHESVSGSSWSAESNSQSGDSGPVPIVLVQGFLGTSGVFSWDYHIHKHHTSPLEPDQTVGRRRRILVPSIGPVSSLHDRACELFYSLVGGTVDYGAGHSATHKHERYGRYISKALYPQWSTLHPLHFVGHSIGGPTITKLQYLLAEGFFGKDYHPDMILSVSAVCAPFRGTQFVYTLGESTTFAPAVRPISIGNVLAKVVHVLAYLSPILPSALDVHADARRLSFKDLSPLEFVKHLWSNAWAESHDAAPFDMTFEAADHREDIGEGIVYPNTFYRSYVSVTTNPISAAIRDFDFDTLSPRPSFCTLEPKDTNTLILAEEYLEEGHLSSTKQLGEEYRANDGIVPVFSQWHPLPCSRTSCQHVPSDYMKACQPGMWHVTTSPDTNHLSLLPRPLMHPSFQRTFWADLLGWLDTVEGQE